MGSETSYKLQIYDQALKILRRHRDDFLVFLGHETAEDLGVQLVHRKASILQLWIRPEIAGDSTKVEVKLNQSNLRKVREIYCLDILTGPKAEEARELFEGLPEFMAAYATRELRNSFDYEGQRLVYLRSGKHQNRVLHRISDQADHLAFGLLQRVVSCRILERNSWQIPGETIPEVVSRGIPEVMALLRLVGI